MNLSGFLSYLFRHIKQITTTRTDHHMIIITTKWHNHILAHTWTLLSGCQLDGKGCNPKQPLRLQTSNTTPLLEGASNYTCFFGGVFEFSVKISPSYHLPPWVFTSGRPGSEVRNLDEVPSAVKRYVVVKFPRGWNLPSAGKKRGWFDSRICYPPWN